MKGPALHAALASRFEGPACPGAAIVDAAGDGHTNLAGQGDALECTGLAEHVEIVAHDIVWDPRIGVAEFNLYEVVCVRAAGTARSAVELWVGSETLSIVIHLGAVLAEAEAWELIVGASSRLLGSPLGDYRAFVSSTASSDVPLKAPRKGRDLARLPAETSRFTSSA